MSPDDEAVAEAAFADPAASDGGPADVHRRPPPRGTERPDAAAAAADPASVPASAGEVYRAYIDQSAIGYIIYLVGAATAFLAVALSLSAGQAGLHSSALAVGVVTAGFLGDRIDGRMGQRRSHMLGVAVLLAGGALLGWAPAFAVTLGAALGVGFGAGLMLAHINQSLTSGGGALARVQLSRSTLVAMSSSVTVPLVIGIGVALGVGWQLSLVPAALLAGLAFLAARGRVERAADPIIHGRLPRDYWLAWFLVVLVVAVEFAVVFWGSTLVERRAGVPLSEATLTISAFIGGMIIGRVALSTHAVGSRDPVWLVRGGALLAALGTLLAWATSSFETAGLGMFLAGLGLGMLYPLTAAITIAAAPGRARLAAGRAVMASGVAILVAPLLLGLVADWSSVDLAWLLIPLLCVAALVLTVPVGRMRRPHPVTPDADRRARSPQGSS